METTVKRIISVKLDWTCPEYAFMAAHLEGACGHIITLIVDDHDVDTEIFLDAPVSCITCGAWAREAREVARNAW